MELESKRIKMEGKLDSLSAFFAAHNEEKNVQRLTGQAKRIIKERRTRALAAQEIRKIENRRRKINLSINEEMTSVKNRNKKIFV